MAFWLDMHLHTRRHSGCSSIDESKLIHRAIEAGVDGIVITDHHYQWPAEELDALVHETGRPDLLVLSAFEYTSSRGDILVYGLAPEQAATFRPGLDPEQMLDWAHQMGAACIAAHPTRAGLDYDDRILRMPFEGIEVKSVNLKPHEQDAAKALAARLGRPATASSDAHRIEDVGAYATVFDGKVGCMAELVDALQAGAFAPASNIDVR
ncbi:MAG: PHP domain-containing protein [Candidatus Hydrogenedentes bacterium]|nr:PHP domain-containing protein [Candidatus Hydrogenedentota bacterium]